MTSESSVQQDGSNETMEVEEITPSFQSPFHRSSSNTQNIGPLGSCESRVPLTNFPFQSLSSLLSSETGGNEEGLPFSALIERTLVSIWKDFTSLAPFYFKVTQIESR